MMLFNGYHDPELIIFSITERILKTLQKLKYSQFLNYV